MKILFLALISFNVFAAECAVQQSANETKEMVCSRAQQKILIKGDRASVCTYSTQGNRIVACSNISFACPGGYRACQ